MNNFPVVVLTGGPGGGKTTLIEELTRDPLWHGRFSALPEAISLMGRLGISMREKLFQRAMVHMQFAMENALAKTLAGEGQRVILCHRGSLDPLAYWLDRGWTEEEFFTYTRISREEHLQRYVAVIHLVTAAEDAEHAYRRWPDAHRPETIEDAIRLDHLLHKVWSRHPNYFWLDNLGRDWAAKSNAAQEILARFV